MKTVRCLLWSITVYPMIVIVTILAIPFFLLCSTYGETSNMTPITDRVGEKLKQSLINFMEGRK